MTATYKVDFVDHQQLSDQIVTAAMPIMVAAVQMKAAELMPKGATGILEGRLYGTVDQGGLRGIVGDRAPHAHLITEGTRPHTITTKHARALIIASAAHVDFRSTVEHPGSQAQPFLTDAAEAERGDIESALADLI